MGLAVAVAGCSESPVTQIEKPSAQGGTRQRLDMFKEKAQEALSKKKK